MTGKEVVNILRILEALGVSEKIMVKSIEFIESSDPQLLEYVKNSVKNEKADDLE